MTTDQETLSHLNSLLVQQLAKSENQTTTGSRERCLSRAKNGVLMGARASWGVT